MNLLNDRLSCVPGRDCLCGKKNQKDSESYTCPKTPEATAEALAQWSEDNCTKTGVNPCPDCKPNDCRNPCYKPPPNTPANTPCEKTSAETAGPPESAPASPKPAAPAGLKPAFV